MTRVVGHHPHMTDRYLEAQDNINVARALILEAWPRGPESHSESAFHYLETANELLRANDIASATREVIDAIERLRSDLDLPLPEAHRAALQNAIERLEQVRAELDAGGGAP